MRPNTHWAGEYPLRETWLFMAQFTAETSHSVRTSLQNETEYSSMRDLATAFHAPPRRSATEFWVGEWAALVKTSVGTVSASCLNSRSNSPPPSARRRHGKPPQEAHERWKFSHTTSGWRELSFDTTPNRVATSIMLRKRNTWPVWSARVNVSSATKSPNCLAMSASEAGSAGPGSCKRAHMLHRKCRAQATASSVPPTSHTARARA